MSVIIGLLLLIAQSHNLTPAPFTAVFACETGNRFDPMILSPDGQYKGIAQIGPASMPAFTAWAARQGVEPNPFDPSAAGNWTADELLAGNAWRWPHCAAARYVSFLPLDRTNVSVNAHGFGGN